MNKPEQLLADAEAKQSNKVFWSKDKIERYRQDHKAGRKVFYNLDKTKVNL